jgi:hypothetical protein
MLNLGQLYVSDFIKDETGYLGKKKYPLNLVLNKEIGAVHLTEAPPHEDMWGKYWYRSGTNNTMKSDLSRVVFSILDRFKLDFGDLWLDIACNDGTLLSNVPADYLTLGIDPADDSFLKEAKEVADDVIQDYFSVPAFKKSRFGNLKAKVVTTISMFYDLQDPDSFIKDVVEVMDDNGLWVMQISYTPLMLKQMAFDNICHEHYYYHSLSSLKILFERNGLEIMDADLNDINGGSIRVYAQKQCRTKETFGTAPLRDVCKFNVEALLELEKQHYNIADETLWENFDNAIQALKDDVVNFIKIEKANGKKICGAGASTKGNTLLQVFGLDNTLIDAIAERSPYKFGLKTVGTNIPILSEQDVRDMKPDYLLILPWHFINEFKQRERQFLLDGGKFIVPCPQFQIITKDDL